MHKKLRGLSASQWRALAMLEELKARKARTIQDFPRGWQGPILVTPWVSVADLRARRVTRRALDSLIRREVIVERASGGWGPQVAFYEDALEEDRRTVAPERHRPTLHLDPETGSGTRPGGEDEV